MIDELQKSIRATLHERTTSPLSGAFLVSWFIWNYRFILALFSGLPLKDKLYFIENELYSGWVHSGLFLFVGPVVTTLIFLLLYPFPARWVYRFWRRRRKELLDIRREIEEETLLTQRESTAIRRRLIDIQSEYDREISRLSQENDDLKKALSEKNEALEQAEDRLIHLDKLEEQFVSSNERSEVAGSLIKQRLVNSPWRLHFNPKSGSRGSKLMLFGPDGEILEGANKNESKWKVKNGMLELVQEDGKIHSRFEYSFEENRFDHTNDEDTLSLPNQYMVPEPKAAQQNAQVDAE